MLTILRKLSENWFFKGILFLTALSFVSLFGVGSFSNLKRSDNIAVGTKDIDLTNQEFVREFVNEISKINKLAKNNISLKDAVAGKMYMPLLARRANEFVMYSLDKELNIDLDKPTLGAVIRSEPIFLNQDGVFSPQQYTYYLSTLNISQQEYEYKAGIDIKDRFISVPLMKSVAVPDVLANAMYKFQNEKRSGQYFSLDLDKMLVTAKPTDDDLKAYYDGFEDDYMAPEYRRATAMFVPFTKIKADITIPEDDLKTRYEEMKASYTIPEKRNVEQILVSDHEKADAVMKELKSGKNFFKVADELVGQSKEDTELGMVTMDSLIAEVADAVFEAEKGKIIGPIESYLGFHILRVTEIVKGEVASYESKREEILDEAKRDLVSDRTMELMDKIDDDFGIGKSLEETAKEVGAKIVPLADMDITGVGRDGKKNGNKFVNSEFLTNLYSSEMAVGQISVTMENDEGLVVFRLDNIDAPAIREFADVKDELFKLWEKDQKQMLLDKAVNAIEKDMANGISISKIAAKYKLQTKNLTNIGRTVVNADIPSAVVDTLFRIDNKGKMLSGKNKTGYVFVVLNNVIAPTKETEDIGIAQVRDDLKNEIADSLYGSFIQTVGNRYRMQINTEGVEKALDTYRNRAD